MHGGCEQPCSALLYGFLSSRTVGGSRAKAARNLYKVWTTWQISFQVLLSLRVPHHMLYNATVPWRIGNTSPQYRMHSFDCVVMATSFAFCYICFASNVSCGRMHKLGRSRNKAHIGISNHDFAETQAWCLFSFVRRGNEPSTRTTDTLCWYTHLPAQYNLHSYIYCKMHLSHAYA